MYIIKNKTYAEAGNYLIGNTAKGLSAPTSMGPFIEYKMDISNLLIDQNSISFDNIVWKNPGINSYSDAKKYIINKRYTNDAQIAIILNKDNSEEDQLAYQKMQEWRDWASILARKIMEVINK